MNYTDAKRIADKYVELLRPFVKRIEIGGSVRRECGECNDIEIVAIRDASKIYQFADIVNQWPRIRGRVDGKYTARVLPEGIQLDLFFATPDNWGNLFFIRTGSADYVKRIACEWVRQGYQSKGGMLHPVVDHYEGTLGDPIPLREEKDVFEFLKIPWVEPRNRR